ncbi:hypothetical protein FHS37_005271 [Streptomyces griseostramineus]|uniref:Uncharacterized protein n=1 Tax=Streptomyces griseomycini TaxID=66895 RepID=A0A7W7PTV2_9ACTN|nr:hypothetical protein [Streptomyces griseomycini]GGR17548.1 hypothetical protein GCM10015536_24120 [Streptomyces griseomycini]
MASPPRRAKYTAEGAARSPELSVSLEQGGAPIAPFPAARRLTWKCSAAAVSHGSPLLSTASVWRPTSFGPAAAHRWNRRKTSGGSRPPHASSDAATGTALRGSSVASPGSRPAPTARSARVGEAEGEVVRAG